MSKDNSTEKRDAENKAELEEFKASVKVLMTHALKNPDEGMRVFQNSGVGHARIVVDEMLDHARHHVYINCQRLSKDVFGKEAITKFLKKTDVKLNVIVDGEDEACSNESLLPDLQSYIDDGKLEVFARSSGGTNYRHFMLVDNHHDAENHLRLETDQEHRKADIFFMCPSVRIHSALEAFEAMKGEEQPLKPQNLISSEERAV